MKHTVALVSSLKRKGGSKSEDRSYGTSRAFVDDPPTIKVEEQKRDTQKYSDPSNIDDSVVLFVREGEADPVVQQQLIDIIRNTWEIPRSRNIFEKEIASKSKDKYVEATRVTPVAKSKDVANPLYGSRAAPKTPLVVLPHAPVELAQAEGRSEHIEHTTQLLRECREECRSLEKARRESKKDAKYKEELEQQKRDMVRFGSSASGPPTFIDNS
ncbi:hypothetical protein RDI58_007037 [Solanum bulbocastanum]|uniref:Uncharacterized protein n=1 Tax=Solanum bulbocastanum TaxID=147425 RepID=A0AAN8YHC4_SOLBU